MNILYTINKIAIVPNLVFPKPALPNRCFSFFLSRFGYFPPHFTRLSTTKLTFNEPPTHRKIRVVFR